MDLEGKAALVLGGIKGIGKGIALALAGAGVQVAVNTFDWQDSRKDLQADLEKTGAPHLILRTDLTETQRVGGMIEKVADRFGRLDILVNNIERGGWPVVHGPYVPEQWDLESHTTLRAKWWVFDRALPLLRASGEGAVVNLSSIAARVGRSGPAGWVFNDGYSALNRGISLLTETWARLGAPEVRVNELMIGFTETRHGPETRGWGLLGADRRRAILEHTLLGRTGRIEDVVRAVLFLVRDADFMTGSVLRLDGGYVLGGDRVPPMPEGVL